MSKYRTFNRGDRFPADWANALGEFLGAAAENFLLRIKPTDATVLQVPAGVDNDQVAIAINGRWRYITATVERASPGGVARILDVYVTASDNVFVAGGGGEDDDTDYSFAVAIVEAGATPGGVALYRKIASAPWDGAKFTAVDAMVGPQAGAARHAATHGPGGSDPLTPAAIGAATAAALASETARAEAAEAGCLPIGAIVAWSGSGDALPGVWVAADGRLIDKTTYAGYYGYAGHRYNLGIDPGANKVKIADKRGRKPVGAIDFGTGAGSSDNSRAQLAAGASGGEVVHTLSISEQPSHSHPGSSGVTGDMSPLELVTGDGGYGGVPEHNGSVDLGPVSVHTVGVGVTVAAQGGGGGHNNLDPYQADTFIVRIA